MNYTLGLDIGVNSIGWAILNRGEHRIEDIGVHLFPAAEGKSSGSGKASPPALPRRQARAQRRRIRRAAARRHRVKELFVQHGLIPDIRGPYDFHPYRDHPAFKPSHHKLTPWDLRAKGVVQRLSGEEFARALFHIISRRGFRSNRKGGFDLGNDVAPAKSSEQQKQDEGMKAGVRQIARKLQQSRYETVGQMLALSKEYETQKRNRAGDYQHTIHRDLLENEILTLFARQREFRNPFATPELEEGVLKAFRYVKPMTNANMLRSLVGRCTFLRGERRSPKNTWTAERFALLQKVNSLTYWHGPDKKFLTAEQREAVIHKAYEAPKVIYADVRQVCNLPADARFTGVDYSAKAAGTTKDEGTATERPTRKAETRTVIALHGYHLLHQACDNGKHAVWSRVKEDASLMDVLSTALYYHKNEAGLREDLAAKGVAVDIIDAVADLLPEGFTGTLDLSHKAIEMLLPHMEDGLGYTEACQAADLAPTGDLDPREDGKLMAGHLPPNVTINPATHRALARCRKLVNAVVAKYGPPYSIHIELARDINMGVDKREEIGRDQRRREKANQESDAAIREYGGNPFSSQNRVKYALWHEQGHRCPYCGAVLTPEAVLCEPDYAELDHIIPRCLSLDDSRANLVLVHTACNRNKGDRLTYNFITENHPARLNAYTSWAESLKDRGKRSRLLKASFDEEERKRWHSRYLNDTRTITTTFAEVLRKNMKFTSPKGKVNVVCLQGGIVAETRKWWGLKKDRSDDLHHAVDAVVVAALRHHQIELITEHARVLETRQPFWDKETGECIQWDNGKKPKLPMPWKGFKSQLETLLAKAHEPVGDGPITRVYVSRLPDCRMAGQMHNATIEPLPNGDPGKRKSESGIRICGGIAGHGPGALLRVDVFRDGKKFRLVPVYVDDFLARRLPDGPGDFVLSLHTSELVRVHAKDRAVTGYYRSADPPGHRLKLEPLLGDNEDDPEAGRHTAEGAGGDATAPTGEAPLKRIGVVTARGIEKFTVGILGDVHKVKHAKRMPLAPKEKRHGVADSSDNQPREAPG